MGIYQDIQDDLAETFETDLSDVYVDFICTDYISNVYDPSTGSLTSVENEQSFKGVVLKYIEGTVIDLPEQAIVLEILVLDSDKPFDFEEKQKITYDSKDFMIMGLIIDPAKATWVLDCMEWE